MKFSFEEISESSDEELPPPTREQQPIELREIITIQEESKTIVDGMLVTSTKTLMVY